VTTREPRHPDTRTCSCRQRPPEAPDGTARRRYRQDAGRGPGWVTRAPGESALSAHVRLSRHINRETCASWAPRGALRLRGPDSPSRPAAGSHHWRRSLQTARSRGSHPRPAAAGPTRWVAAAPCRSQRVTLDTPPGTALSSRIVEVLNNPTLLQCNGVKSASGPWQLDRGGPGQAFMRRQPSRREVLQSKPPRPKGLGRTRRQVRQRVLVEAWNPDQPLGGTGDRGRYGYR
jgi:hypothetical protein